MSTIIPAGNTDKTTRSGRGGAPDVPSQTPTTKIDAWREDLRTLAYRSGLKFVSEEHQDQQGTWWAFYYLNNPDGSKGHYLGSGSGTNKTIAKEHAAMQSYGTLTTLITTWTQNAAVTSTSATVSINTDPENVWLQELQRLAKEKGLRFVCDQQQDLQGMCWATYHLINPHNTRYFQLGSRGASASNIAIERAAHDAVETLKLWIATWQQPGTAAGSSAAGGSFALENAGPTALAPWNGPSQMFSGGRSIRLVLYGRISAEDVHSIWIDHQSTYGDIVKELATIDATCTFTVLEPIWGPTPQWAEANPKSLIENASHVLYAVIKDDRRYIVGVVRASLSDYPVAIFESRVEPLRTVTQAIIASHPELRDHIKSITGLLEGQSGRHTDLLMDQNFKSVVIINASDDPPKTLMERLPTGSVPPLLRVPFAHCENLMEQAYDLEFFALQIIHVLRAIMHIIISIAKRTEAAFKDDSSDVETALLSQGEVSEWLRATPMLARNLQQILDSVEELMDSVTTADQSAMQKEIEKAFDAVCGDYPGAVDVRHSHRLFTKLGRIDHEEATIHSQSTNRPRQTQTPADASHHRLETGSIDHAPPHQPKLLNQDHPMQSNRSSNPEESQIMYLSGNSSARKLLNQRAQNNWGERHNSILTKHFDQTGILNDQRWVCTIKFQDEVIARSGGYTNRKDAHEAASLWALNWMTEHGLR